MVVLGCLLHIFLVAISVSVQESHQTRDQVIKKLQKKGDLILGGLFPIHEKSNLTENECGMFYLQPGYQSMVAMLFALEKINNSSEILPNITLGTKIYDTCRSTTIGADRAREFIKDTLFVHKDPLVAVIGPFVSDVSLATAPLLRVFGIPQVSYGSSSSALSNKELYSNYFRTVPPDTFQAEAIVDILEMFNWKYIVTISSKGNYGETGISELQVAAKKRSICIALSQSLPYLATTSDYKKAMEEIQKDAYKKVNIIVLFTTKSDSSGLLRAAVDVDAHRFTWIGSSGWSNRIDGNHGNQRIVANGSITVNYLGGYVKGFEEYYTNLQTHTQTPWKKELLSCNHDNSHSQCALRLSLPNMDMSPVRLVVNAVYAVAYALHDMQLTACRGRIGMCEAMKANLREDQLVVFLRNTSFPDAVTGQDTKFNSNQEMDGNYSIMNFQHIKNSWNYVMVGEWGVTVSDNGHASKDFHIDTNLTKWGKSSSEPPKSTCSDPCAFPFIRKPLQYDSQCCWECEKCHVNQIIMNDSCHTCPQGYRPNANLTTCKMIHIDYLSLQDTGGIVSASMAAVGMVATLTTGIIFINFRNHAVVKASGKDLVSIIVFGIMLCYTSVFTLLIKPSTFLCALNRYLGSVCFTFCYAPLLMKTNRIYRIFTRGKTSISRPIMVSPSSQILGSLGLVSVQVVITTIWMISSPPSVQLHYHSLDSTEIECNTGSILLASKLSYNLLLMLVCTYFAFKTRDFPRNFNEAKFIGIMMYLICSVWVIFLPTILNTHSPLAKIFINIASYWLIATIMLIGLFFPKIYVILNCKDNGQAVNQNDVISSRVLASGSRNENFSLPSNSREKFEPSSMRTERKNSKHTLANKKGDLGKNSVNLNFGSLTSFLNVTPSLSVTPSSNSGN